ncbi:MAG: antitoxin [Chloroflexi bacterium]|nr:antitoxin [Chloroflexota bacterium]
MKTRFRLLAQRIRDEMEEIERTVDAVGRHWRRFQKARTDQDAFLNSVALNLHGFYSGVERILELIALELDGGTLGGEAWHAELLRQMQSSLSQVRPAVLSHETADWLDEYRKFRHRVRNIYATNLVPDRMQLLVRDLPSGWRRLRHELETFATFLENLAGKNQSKD